MGATNPTGPNRFCWAEIVTTDIAAAREFYGQLFGWESVEQSAGDRGTYTMFQIGGEHVGGGFQHGPGEGQPGEHPRWNSYVLVESADATAEKAAQLGGQVFMPPMDVMDSGRMTVLADPTGAVIQLWEAKSHTGYGVSGVHGAPCWNELMTRDRAAGEAFYTALFGWTTNRTDTGSSDPYTVFFQGERQVAGCLAMPPEIPKFVPPHWLVYFQVDDCDASVARCKELRGALVAGPMEVAEVGRFAVLSDPQGPTFAVLQFATPR